MKCWCGREGDHARTPVCTPESLQAGPGARSTHPAHLCKCGHDVFTHEFIPAGRCSVQGCECGACEEAAASVAEPAPVLRGADGINDLSHLPNAAERRRYALLQAAAVLYSAFHRLNAERIVEVAESLLAEIERREAAQEVA